MSRERGRASTGIGPWLAGLCAVGAMDPVTAQAQVADPAGTATLAEVVVTARRIEENLQAVPMSVQAISGELLEATGTTRLLDLQFAVPGLVINTTGMFGAGFSLRGVADQRVAGLAVAPHLNGIYLGDASLAIARMFDLERIEVLKGPQGTLYGRNSTAGSMNLITRAPRDLYSADVEASYGSFDTMRTQGHVNVPAGGAAIRVAFIASEGDGYIRNTVDRRTFAEEDFWGLRASLRIDAGDDLRIDVMAQHIRDDGASGDLWTPRPDFLADPDDIRLTTVTLDNPYLISDTDNFNVNFQYDFGAASLRSLTGYARSDVRNLDDCAGMPVLIGCVRGASPSEYDQWSQEFQLVFPGRGPWQGIVGAYFADSDDFLHFHQFIPRLNAQTLNDHESSSEDTAAAVFGQATVRLAENWSLTGGLRLSWEEQRVHRIGTGVNDVPPVLSGEDDSDDVSWRLDLQRAVSDDVLLYGSVATGYKSGGFVTSTPGQDGPDRYEPENLTAYELGGKTQWLGRRLTLNAAAFYYDFTDMQVSTTVIGSGGVTVDVDNAASAELYGLDVEFHFQASERFLVSAAAVWLPQREFVDFDENSTGESLTGNELVRAPEWTATGAFHYELPLHDLGALSARLEYNYRSGYFYTPDNDPDISQDGFGLLNLFLRFEAASESWYLFASGRNLAGEDYFNQIFFQSSPGYPATYEVGAGYRF
jgi:iron complex outermembrane recepter protein